MSERIIIRNTQCPGDYVVLTAAIRDINTQYPGRFNFVADTLQNDIFRYNPNIEIGGKYGRSITATYNKSPYGIGRSNQNKNHFMWGFLGDLNMALKTQAVLSAFRPDLYVSAEEKAAPPIKFDRPYWVFVSGGKADYTAKIWDPFLWSQVIETLSKEFIMVQVGGGSHKHPVIKGSYDLTGRTSFRELMRLIYHSHGVICIVTCLMHIAAGYNKPCVIIAGGREPYTWEAYTEETRLFNMRIGIPTWNPPAGDTFIPHKYLHTIGKLECCHSHGCWRSRVDGHGILCKDVVSSQSGSGVRFPRCLSMITPDMVVDSVHGYYREGILERGKGHLVSVPVPAILAPKPPLVESVPAPEIILPPDPQDTHVFVFSNPGTSPGYAQALHSFFKPWPVTVSSKEKRLEFMRKAASLAQKNKILWIEYPVVPLANFKDWCRLAGESAGGIVCWRRVSDPQMTLIRSAAWYQGHNLRPHKFDGAPYTVYLRRGFFMIGRDLFKLLNWPDERSEENLELLLGAALDQFSIPLVDGGHVVKEYA